jgi:NAD(P)-dependent dehydrogenase (short-subunit alcohol dehydrogenase family)
MDIDGAKVLVCGASGALGGGLATALHEAGARVVPAGRDVAALEELAGSLGTTALGFDVVDVASCRAAVEGAVEQLGGLDALVVTVGVAGFGRAVELDDAVAEELFAVNALGPMALVRAAAPHLEGGVAVVVSAVLADLPTAQMADYSAAKSALATWLGVVRREERRRRMRVLDVRPPHLDTGLETRALAGEPPRLPEGAPSADVVARVVAAMRDDAKEVVVDLGSGELVTR